MKVIPLLCFLCILSLGMLLTAPVYAEAIPVGSSSLIGTLDYSDTYTLTDDGGIDDRVVNGWNMGAQDYPVNGTPGEGLAVENCHGNTPRAWSDWKFSISDNDNVINGTSIYPGDSGGGSATGMTQTGAYNADWGIEYGLRSQFVIQFDAVQVADRVDISIGAQGRDNIYEYGVGDLSVFFREPGTGFGEVSIYVPEVGAYDTPFQSGLTFGQWHNYAVKFDLDARTLEPFVNEQSLGVVDLNTFAGGAFVGVSLSANVVSVGFCDGPDRFWTDNFQVGAPVPEPGTVTLGLAAALGLAAFLRKKKNS